MNAVSKLLLLLLFAVAAPAAAAEAPISDENAAILRQIASLREKLTRVRMASFEKLPLEDQNKSARIIAELLNRAEQKIYNLLPPGRFEWSWTGFDGKLVKGSPSAPLQGEALPGKLAIGNLVEGGLGCDGVVDNVRISRGAREIGSASAAPLLKDEATLGLWDFDEP